MFKVCGSTGISKIEFFNFFGTERVRKKEKVHIMNFSGKEKVYIIILRTEKDDLSVLKKNDKMIFSLAWNTMFTDYCKVLILNIPELENTAFFKPKRLWKDDIY